MSAKDQINQPKEVSTYNGTNFSEMLVMTIPLKTLL